jgi:hypothetical protein
METDPVSETLCSLEYWTMDKVQQAGSPEREGFERKRFLAN